MTPNLRTAALECERTLLASLESQGHQGFLAFVSFRSASVELWRNAVFPLLPLCLSLTWLASWFQHSHLPLLTRRTLTFGGFESDSVSFRALSSSCLWLSLNRMFCVVSERRPHPFPFAMPVMGFHLIGKQRFLSSPLSLPCLLFFLHFPVLLIPNPTNEKANY